MKNKWKTTAIIFIILFILQTFTFIWGVYLAKQEDKDLLICKIDICGYNQNTEEFESEFSNYAYDPQARTCGCIDESGRIDKIEEFGK